MTQKSVKTATHIRINETEIQYALDNYNTAFSPKTHLERAPIACNPSLAEPKSHLRRRDRSSSDEKNNPRQQRAYNQSQTTRGPGLSPENPATTLHPSSKQIEIQITLADSQFFVPFLSHSHTHTHTHTHTHILAINVRATVKTRNRKRV